MDPEIKNHLLELAKKAEQAGSDAYAFIQAQAPELVKETLRWLFWSNLLLAIVCAIGCGLFAWLTKRLWTSTDEHDGMGPSPVIMLPGVASIVFMFVSIASLFDLVQVLVAPRLALLEALGHAMKH